MGDIWVEGNEEVLDRPRAVLASRFTEWLFRHSELSGMLPKREISVEILNAELLPRRFSGRGERAVGVFLISDQGWLTDEYRTLVAYGEEAKDSNDVKAWLTTVAHGIVLVSEFAEAHQGKTPKEVGPVFFQIFDAGARRDEVEQKARNLMDWFERENSEELEDPGLLAGVKVKKPRTI